MRIGCVKMQVARIHNRSKIGFKRVEMSHDCGNKITRCCMDGEVGLVIAGTLTIKEEIYRQMVQESCGRIGENATKLRVIA